MLYEKPSVGLDGIPQQVLKDMADIIVRLAIIFEKLQSLWGIPHDWADVTPSFKNSKKQDLDNCRLISLTSILRKITEHIHF